jgi:ATP-dependent RNA helicase DHX37/DHR1
MAPFVPRERKHRRLEKQKTQLSQGRDVNSNAESLTPATPSEKEDRRRRLREELAVPGQDKISSKKKKRLEKYIDTKLKKEENLELLKKLAQNKVDTSLLKSSKNVGRQEMSRREVIERALREREKGVDVDGRQDQVLFERRRSLEDGNGGEAEEEDEEHGEEEVEEQEVAAVVAKPAENTASTFGSGLKRPLEVDEAGQPVIKKRKRRKQAKIELERREPETQSDEDQSEEEEQDSGAEDDAESEWNGFDSGNEDLLSGASGPQSDEEGESSGESASESESESESEDDEESEDKPARVSAFKAWADSQRNESLGFTPSTAPTNDPEITAAFKPRAPSPDQEASEIANAIQHPNKDACRPATAVVVPRSDEVQAARLELPVVQDEQKIMEAIHNNPIVVVCGATGSGKTTQLPQMLLENGYATTGMIGITQPRRVAAVSVASRVAHELGPEYGKKVAHQVRYDSTVARDTTVKFMTDGILLREIGNDFVLSKYSAIVIDEAHERSVNTDILIGMLSRIVPLRQELSREAPDKHHPLKLIIMSATLRVADFLANDRLFRSIRPPIVQAEGRQYAVTEHFARRTQRDYVAETVAKVSRGHRKLPPGGILVFLTGQEEIQTVAKRLKEVLGGQAEGLDFSRKRGHGAESRKGNDYLERELDDHSDSESEPEITGIDDDEDDAEFAVEADPAAPAPRGPLKAHILPLYASLPTSQQMRVFEPVPDDSRIIVLATNVAETSLTIPNIKYVFDCGRSKEKDYNISTGVQEFKIDWISKASASQRMGRAGRTGPGHCYRLYSSAIYEQYFDEHTLPEILRTPIEGTVLQLKNMEVDNVVNFPFPTPPQSEQLSSAVRLLRNLGAIDIRVGKITDIGKELIHYPVNPRFGKMLLLGLRNKVLAHTIALVAGLAVGDLFIPEPQIATKNGGDADSESDPDERQAKRSVDAATFTAAQQRRQAYGRANAKLSGWDDKSDAIKLLTAVAAHAQAEDSVSFCAEFFLREKGMVEVQQLRRQLWNIMQVHIKTTTASKDAAFTLDLPPPSATQIAMLKQIVAAGYIDQVAVRLDLLPTSSVPGKPPRRAIEVAYRTLLPTAATTDQTATIAEQEQSKNVYPHSGSVLSRLSVPEMPAYIVYSTLSRASANTIGEKQKRTRMHPLATVGPKQLAALAEGTPLLDVGKPIGKIIEKDAGKKRECWVGVSLRSPENVGGIGWPLGAWKMVQKRVGREWVVETVIDRGGGGNAK